MTTGEALQKVRLETIKQSKNGSSVLVMRIIATQYDGTEIYRDIDLSGSATSVAKWGALEAVDAINAMLQKT
jgi:hypothetical protein